MINDTDIIDWNGTGIAGVRLETKQEEAARLGTMQVGTHYAYDYKGIRLDPYRILDVYNITHPAHQHAIKKLLRLGKSIKDRRTDLLEVRATLDRFLEMIEEETTTTKEGN